MNKKNKQPEGIYSILDFGQGFITYRNEVCELTDVAGFFQE